MQIVDFFISRFLDTFEALYIKNFTKKETSLLFSNLVLICGF